jgi:hypothetical protein
MHRRVTVLALCLCVYHSVATISARLFVSKHKTRYHRLLYGVLLDFAKKASFRRYGCFSSLDDRDQLFLTENIPLVLGTATIDFVHVALAILLNYFWSRTSFHTLGSLALMAMAYGHVFVSWLPTMSAAQGDSLWSDLLASGVASL